jgi:hypothetical protein
MHALTDAFALSFFRTALIISLVLAGIHAYLGFHIVRRGVLFVDLALAQMAALGVAIALAMDLEHHPIASYMLSLGMTFVAAALFAWLRGRSRSRGIPLEAFIGIVFATAQAAVFLILEKSPSGPEHLKETLVGSLFTVDPKHVLRVTLLYVAVSILHILLRKPFFEITNDPHGAEQRGLRCGGDVGGADGGRAARVRFPGDPRGGGTPGNAASGRGHDDRLDIRIRGQCDRVGGVGESRHAGGAQHSRDAHAPPAGGGCAGGNPAPDHAR